MDKRNFFQEEEDDEDACMMSFFVVLFSCGKGEHGDFRMQWVERVLS